MSTFKNPAFTSQEHWGNNDDPADLSKPRGSLTERVAKTPLGRAMQLYAEEVCADNMTPEDILIAKEEGLFEAEDINPMDYSDHAGIDGKDVFLTDSELDLCLNGSEYKQIDMENNMRKKDAKRLKVIENSKFNKAFNKGDDGSRQLPSKMRSKSQKSAQAIADRFPNETIDETPYTPLSREEILLAGKNATPEQLAEWNDILNMEEKIMHERWATEFRGEISGISKQVEDIESKVRRLNNDLFENNTQNAECKRGMIRDTISNDSNAKAEIIQEVMDIQTAKEWLRAWSKKVCKRGFKKHGDRQPPEIQRSKAMREARAE